MMMNSPPRRTPEHGTPQPADDEGKGPSGAGGADAFRTQSIYRLLVESVQDYAIFALDAAGHVRTWSTGAARLKGYARTEIIGRHFSTFYPPDDVAARKPEHELEVAAQVGRLEDHGWRVRKDGSRFWASVVITALRDELGVLIGFAKVTRDLTERQREIESLRRSEERFRLLVDSVRDYAIFVLDPAGHVATWNTGAERIKGYSAEDIVGQHFSKFYPEEKIAERFPEYELEVAAREGRFEDEGWRIRKDGSRFWANVVITALRDSETRLLGFAKVTRDLTQRRETEEQARRLAAEAAARTEAERRSKELLSLTERLQAQTVQLEQQSEESQSLAEELEQTNGELHRALASANEAREAERVARVEAERANQVKGEFLAAMSHELRTPLNAIGGYAQLLNLGLRGPVTPAQHEDLERIQKSQLHLTGLINELLSYARLESGTVSYELAPTLVSEVFAAVTPFVEPQRAAKDITLDVRTPKRSGRPPRYVQADHDKLQQILLNLLSNALKFTPAGGRVTLEELEEPDARGLVVLRVVDSGIGIPEDKLEAIFQPFVQLGRSLNSPGEGTGLGLAISRDLARGMGGELTVTSVPGAGSAFTLALPTA